MKVGTICKLKVDCLGNKAGTLGVVFYDYGDGFQAIFENGNYDGFSRIHSASAVGDKAETDLFLEEVGFEKSLAGYHFRGVLQVSADYRKGFFNIAWSENWKNFAKGKTEQDTTEEKCEVYADGCKPPWLRFKREKMDGEGVTVCMLSAAKDYADFSHFEYAEFSKPVITHARWMQKDKTIWPQFVVFRKKVRNDMVEQ